MLCICFSYAVNVLLTYSLANLNIFYVCDSHMKKVELGPEKEKKLPAPARLFQSDRGRNLDFPGAPHLCALQD